jgi:hypothetical protein
MTHSSTRSPRAGAVVRRALALTLVAVAPVAGCISRDVAALEPSTKTSFEVVVPQQSIDKIDLLLVIDDSRSMADKQRILADAVPDLVVGLLRPRCLDAQTRAPTGGRADPTKDARDACPAGSEPEFKPISDMHVGIVSTSLGSVPGAGGKAITCAADVENRRGHLVAQRANGERVVEAGPHGFLSWYPAVPRNDDKRRHPDPEGPKIGDIERLSTALAEMVVGVGQRGCGLEAQLESAYRFLVQPDPWARLVRDGDRVRYPADGEDIDADLLAQRAAFLRPDSLVAVIMLTDEDDSWPDPLAFDGSAWRFAEASFGGNEGDGAFRATRACEADPASEACTSCALAPADPSCSPPRYRAAEDDINVRFHAMKRRYGVEPRFPIQRYVDGLTAPRVPSRGKEHDASGRYAPTPACTNPLFAARLPTKVGDDLCRLPRGPRNRDLVYFGVIGGVAPPLLPEKGGAEAVDWTRVLGRDPARFDETGIDPHMRQSTSPRAGLPSPGSAETDPVHGREWDTRGTDLQYACTFDLFEQSATGPKPVRQACEDKRLCDCPGDGRSPVCAPDDPNVQVKGKAYPTVRELWVARELGDHAVVASLCPKQLTRPADDDYGYRPAARAIVDRLADGLVSQCLPRALATAADGTVSCAVVATMPDAGPSSACRDLFGLSPAPAELVAELRAEDGDDVAPRPSCLVPQLVVPAGQTCTREAEKIGFCYVEGANARCSHALQLSEASSRLVNARFTLHCIQQTGTQ